MDLLTNLGYQELSESFGWLNEQVNTMYLLAGTLLFIVAFNIFLKWWRMCSYFKKLNIRGPTPLPLVGNFLGLIKDGFDVYDPYLMKKYNRTCGMFEGSTPVILTSDPKFIKSVMIKDSASFVNRRTLDGLLLDPFDKFMTVLKDDEWKNVRSIVTSTFTSGKLKELMKLVKKTSKNVAGYVDTVASEDKEINAKT